MVDSRSLRVPGSCFGGSLGVLFCLLTPRVISAAPLANATGAAPAASATVPKPAEPAPAATSAATPAPVSASPSVSVSPSATPTPVEPPLPGATAPASNPAASNPAPANPDGAPAKASAATASSAPTAASKSDVAEPPLPAAFTEAAPVSDAPVHLAPEYALIAGARVGWLFPTGSAWQDGTPVGSACCAYTERPLDEFVSSGPLIELNLGARISHNYVLLGFWEYASLGKGALENEFGGQRRGSSSFLGGAFRFLTNPDGLGFAVELAVGWRRVAAEWNDGTKLLASDNFLNARIGAGGEWRLSETLTASALLTLGGGSFGKVDWTFPDGSKQSALSGFDRSTQHVPIGLQIAIHYDVWRSKEP